MKKLFSVFLAMMVLVPFHASLAEAPAEETGEPAAAQGFVMEVGKDTLLVQGADGSVLQVNLSDETALTLSAPIAVGDMVTVYHAGATTRSIPPQTTAMAVVDVYLQGTVSAVEEGQFLLTTEDGMEAVVLLSDDVPSYVQEGMDVTVFYNGMMTRSLPPQINALYIRGQLFEGVMVAMEESDLLLDTKNGEVVVHISEDTRVLTTLEIGAAVRVATDGISTMSLPPQYRALEVLPALEMDE